MRILGVTASSILKVTSSYESIATATATGSETSFTFSSIAQTYASLQLRCILRKDNSFGNGNMGLRPNNETSTSFYTQHNLKGNGTSATASGAATGTYSYGINLVEFPSNSSGAYSVQIWDLHDYASTTKNKTIRTFSGFDTNGAGQVGLSSNLYVSTTAITSLVVYFGGDGVSAGSTFALYGIKGA